MDMALIDCKDPLYDRQVNKILQMIEEAIERNDISRKLGYKNPVSLDNYMRLRNLSWNTRQKKFVSAIERYSCKGKDSHIQLQDISKTELIISLFEKEESEAKEIARKVGFDTHIELANYMKSKGYSWNSREGNYTKITGDEVQTAQQEESIIINSETTATEILENIIPLLRNLQKSEQGIALSEETLSLPRYQVKGMYGTKAVRMANVLDLLVRDYSTDKKYKPEGNY